MTVHILLAAGLLAALGGLYGLCAIIYALLFDYRLEQGEDPRW